MAPFFGYQQLSSAVTHSSRFKLLECAFRRLGKRMAVYHLTGISSIFFRTYSPET